MTGILALASGLALLGPALAAPTGVSAARQAMERRRAADGVHAYGLVLAPEDGPIWTGSAGDLRPDVRLPLGSASGALTALAVVEAASRGALQLTDPVERHAPGVGLRGVTVQHLLDHTSGLPAWAGDRLWTLPAAPLEPLAQAALAGVPRGPVGGSERSSLNDLLAGVVLQAALGRPYPEALEATLLRPMALQQTGVADPPLAPTYRSILGWPVAARLAHPAPPALGLVSSLRDLGRLGQHLLEGRSAGSKAVLGHGGQPWQLGWTPIDLGGVPGLRAAGDGPDTRVDLVLVPREETFLGVVADTGGLWGLASDGRAGLEATWLVLGQPALQAPGHAGLARGVGAGLLGALALALAALWRTVRRPARRRALAVTLRAVPAAGLVGALAWLTVANPMGPAAWALLGLLQPDLVAGLGLVTAAWLLALGAAAVWAPRG